MITFLPSTHCYTTTTHQTESPLSQKNKVSGCFWIQFPEHPWVWNHIVSQSHSLEWPLLPPQPFLSRKHLLYFKAKFNHYLKELFLEIPQQMTCSPTLHFFPSALCSISFLGAVRMSYSPWLRHTFLFSILPGGLGTTLSPEFISPSGATPSPSIGPHSILPKKGGGDFGKFGNKDWTCKANLPIWHSG